jgi:hypothetical protein
MKVSRDGLAGCIAARTASALNPTARASTSSMLRSLAPKQPHCSRRTPRALAATSVATKTSPSATAA